MHKQPLLPLSGLVALTNLWTTLPERNRAEVITAYARLIAQAAKAKAPTSTEEQTHARKR